MFDILRKRKMWSIAFDKSEKDGCVLDLLIQTPKERRKDITKCTALAFTKDEAIELIKEMQQIVYDN